MCAVKLSFIEKGACVIELPQNTDCNRTIILFHTCQQQGSGGVVWSQFVIGCMTLCDMVIKKEEKGNHPPGPWGFINFFDFAVLLQRQIALRQHYAISMIHHTFFVLLKSNWKYGIES